MNDEDRNLQLQDIRDRYQRLLARLESNEREFRRLGRSVLRVQEDERRRLARELHDGIGQNLTALQHRLEQVRHLLPAGDDDGASHGHRHLVAAMELCRGALDDTRQMSRLLRPPILDDLGLAPALQWLARTQGEASGVAISVEIEPLPDLGSELDTLVFRVAQEALQNVAKHANASNVLLRLVARAGMLQLQVADDGRGCEPGQALQAGGSGLGGMRERLRLHGGRLEVHSSPGGGTRIRALVPLDGD